MAQTFVVGSTDAKILGEFLREPCIPVLPGRYAEPHQRILVTLGQECSINNDLYTPEGSEKEVWGRIVWEFFDGGWRESEKKSPIVVDTLKILGLYPYV